MYGDRAPVPVAEDAATDPVSPYGHSKLMAEQVLRHMHEAERHMGVAVLPLYLAHEALDKGTVVPVMQDYVLPAQEVHAVFPSPKLVPSKVTHFIGFLQQALAGEWWAKPQRRAQSGG